MDSADIAKTYDAYYYAHGCGSGPYERNATWLDFFGSIADRIVSDIQPKSVLDAGCGLGMLVECLRQRGVDAYGIDVSEYAIQNVYAEIRPYCWVGSITDPFPRRYDLIIAIEVLEHLPTRDAERAVENFCRHADDILFSSTPFDFKEATHFNVRPPEYWAELFARHGFFHDVEFDASFITPWAKRFRVDREPVWRIIAAYERKLWQLQQGIQATRQLAIEQRNELAKQEQTLLDLQARTAAFQTVVDGYEAKIGEQAADYEAKIGHHEVAIKVLQSRVKAMEGELANWAARWASLENSLGGRLLGKLQGFRAWIAPPRSIRDQVLDNLLQRFVLRPRRVKHVSVPELDVAPITPRPDVQPHQATVDIVVCVHNALDDVRRCLESVVARSTLPYAILLVDDGSDVPTRDYLVEFAKTHGAQLLRNETATGYAHAANLGMQRAAADYVVLLNSDTIVTPGWLDRMAACAESDSRIGVVGPLSNTASWQSIPDVFDAQNDWAENPLPPNMTVEQMGELVAQYSDRLYPEMSLLNGFCLMMRQAMLRQVGYFDDETFSPAFGEEDDLMLRARRAGWRLALADDVHIHHAQSRSYSHERRKQLSERAGAALARKHGQDIISRSVEQVRYDRVLEGLRAHHRANLERVTWIERGRAQFAGRRVLFVLPVAEPGGGANVVIDEAHAMQSMGVNVVLFNLSGNRASFERGYPGLNIPAVYGQVAAIPTIVHDYDAVVATVNFTVEWLASITPHAGRPIRGYYVQDFEPYFYAESSADYQRALASYTLLPDLVRYAKTEWTREEVKKHTGADCTLVGPSFNIDLFRPRSRPATAWPKRPLRVSAMVRLSTPYRGPALTTNLLRRLSQTYRDKVEVVVFGTTADDPGWANLPRDFPWKTAGIIGPQQTARLLNEVDIFVDFSAHQAMGLTALEAMACGAAVIVPANGGAVTFAHDGENSLVVDTSSEEACWRALQRLVSDDDLRRRVQRQALIDASMYYPERPAFNILSALFDPKMA